MAIRVCWGHMEPPFWGEGEVVGVSDGTIRRAMAVSYRLSIVTVALSVTIRPQFAIECLRRSNQQGVGHFGPKFRGCSRWRRRLMFGSAESEHPRLTNLKLFWKNSNLCDHNPPTSQTDGQTDGQTNRQTDDMRSQDRALH